MKAICQMRSKTVAEIIINRPDKRNAVDFDVINELAMHLNDLKANKELTVLIIRGEGDVFCSGGDLYAFHKLKTREEALTMLKLMSDVLKTIATFPITTVSLLNGTAVGGGAELATATDYRMSLNGKGKVGFIQGNLHITTGWGGATLLKKRIGVEKAFKILGTSSLYTMNELEELGFIHAIINDLSTLDSWCDQWTKPKVIQTYKQVLFSEQERKELSLSIDKEVEACASLWELTEHHEAVQNFLQKR